MENRGDECKKTQKTKQNKKRGGYFSSNYGTMDFSQVVCISGGYNVIYLITLDPERAASFYTSNAWHPMKVLPMHISAPSKSKGGWGMVSL